MSENVYMLIFLTVGYLTFNNNGMSSLNTGTQQGKEIQRQFKHRPYNHIYS